MARPKKKKMIFGVKLCICGRKIPRTKASCNRAQCKRRVHGMRIVRCIREEREMEKALRRLENEDLLLPDSYR